MRKLVEELEEQGGDDLGANARAESAGAAAMVRQTPRKGQGEQLAAAEKAAEDERPGEDAFFSAASQGAPRETGRPPLASNQRAKTPPAEVGPTHVHRQASLELPSRPLIALQASGSASDGELEARAPRAIVGKAKRFGVKRLSSSVTEASLELQHDEQQGRGDTHSGSEDGKRRRLNVKSQVKTPEQVNVPATSVPRADLYKDFFHDVPDLLAFVSAEGKVVMANRLFTDSFALRERETVEGAHFADVLCPDAAAIVRNALHVTKSGGTIANKEIKLRPRIYDAAHSLGSLSSCSSDSCGVLEGGDPGEDFVGGGGSSSDGSDCSDGGQGGSLNGAQARGASAFKSLASLSGKSTVSSAPSSSRGGAEAMPISGISEMDITSNVDALLRSKGEAGASAQRIELDQGINAQAPSRVRVFMVSASPKMVDGDFCGVRLILRDVSKQYATDKALRVARTVAEDASKAKSDMMSTITHEIRTPLVSVLGFSELILDTGLTPSQRELVHKITRSGDVLLKLLNNFLDLAKVEAHAIDLEHSEFKLLYVLQSVHELLSERAMTKKIKWEVDVRDEVPINVVGDQGRLTQILINLVSNAIKFTGPGGTITLRVRGTPLAPDGANNTSKNPQSMMYFEVIDSGVGIPKDQAEKIFKPFRQATTSTTRKYGGTGLGLPLSRSLAALLNGRITLTSEPGRGSAFTLEMPVERLEDGKLLKPALYNNGLSNLLEECSEPGRESGRLAADAVLTHGLASRGLRVLLVEDTSVNQLIFKAFLEKASIKVDVAADGIEAVEQFKTRPAQSPYDLILMDLQMPRLDGFDATAQIRTLEASQKRSRTPIIALTAFSSGRDLDRCLAAGCDNYIIKPVKRDELFVTISKTLSLGDA
ncbi:Two-component response regulator ORR41 [Hondaea fermentalgiana]|uniref:Two-component response regulator ORR41 n=1 Tax=Hondaea fermentalgiana TaxID=2315210 RepID=A0A2R5G6N2_9STRA|nr:Two-component response regulator ORR41 [Hondaea fermentalgiana]|eukprot:GBG26712.1 Two-component response regulator ORR41 [Hondaea fermentalgiana]